MSQSRKKMSACDLSQLSFTQKAAEHAYRREFRRKCCDKENQCSREGRQCKSKDQSKSLKKQIKKKYLEEEVQKMLQKRNGDSEAKIRQFKQRNDNEYLGLRQDLKSMKDVIMKLSIEDKRPKQVVDGDKDSEFERKCLVYKKKVEKIENQLECQRSRNAVLEETQAQSQLIAEQSKRFSETIRQQLEELTSKHLKCEENMRQLNRANQKIKQLEIKQKEFQSKQSDNEKKLSLQIQKLSTTLKEKQSINATIKQRVEQLKSQNIKLKEQIGSLKSVNLTDKANQNQLKQLQSAYEQLIEDKQLIQQQFMRKIEEGQKQIKQAAIFKKKTEKIFEQNKHQLQTLQQKLKKQSFIRLKLEAQIRKMEVQLNRATLDLGNTKIKLGGLSSMEQKCEELYQQIKKQKTKWNKFTEEATNERQLYEQRLEQLKSQNDALKDKFTQITHKNIQLEKQLQKSKEDNYRLVQDKVRLAKEIKILEESTKQNQVNQSKVKEREKEWKKERKAFEDKIQHLQNQVIGSLQVAKKRSDEIQINNASMQKQVTRLMNEKQILYQRFNLIQQIVIANEEETSRLKEQFSQKEKYCETQKANIEEVNIRMNNQSKELMKAFEQIGQLKNKIKQMEENSSSQIHHIQAKILEIQQKQSIIINLKDQYDRQQEQIQNLQSILGQKQTNSAELNYEINSQRQKITELNQIIKKNENITTLRLAQFNELHAKLEKTQILLHQATQNLNKIQANGRTIIIELEQKYESIKIKLQINEKEAKQLRERYTSTENLLQTERLRREESQSKVRSLESLSYSLTSEIQLLQSGTKRNEQQLEWLQQEISLKNKSISDLKQTIRTIKDESILIKEEVDTYRAQFEQMRQLKDQQTNKVTEQVKKFEELSLLTNQVVKYIKQRLDDLNSDKIDIEIQLKRTQAKNQQLEEKINNINIQLQEKQLYENRMQQLQAKIRQFSTQRQQREIYNNQRAQLLLDSQYKDKEIVMIKSILQEERSAFATKLLQARSEAQATKTNLESQAIISEKLTKIIQDKQETIRKLNEKNSAYEQKRIKIINEVHSIQNQISQLSNRNNLLEQENSELQQKVREAEQKNKIYEQKINILMENKYAMEQQKNALEDQSKSLHQEILKGKSRQKLLEEQTHKKIDQIYSISQQRKNQAIKALRQKIQELMNEISISSQKVNKKNEEIEELFKKQKKLQDILRQNHVLLAEERRQRQKLTSINSQLTITIQNSKLQSTSKEREYECLIRDKTILKEKLIEIESKYESLVKRYQEVEREKVMAQRQIENQSVSLRILREENKSIEKVMTEQLNQRKAIIEQLVNEKRMLYTQFQHE